MPEQKNEGETGYLMNSAEGGGRQYLADRYSTAAVRTKARLVAL
jgi:hypothetical protein